MEGGGRGQWKGATPLVEDRLGKAEEILFLVWPSKTQNLRYLGPGANTQPGHRICLGFDGREKMLAEPIRDVSEVTTH